LRGKEENVFLIRIFRPQAGLALPFPFDEKEAIPRTRDVKTNPQPGVLTALALVSNKVNTNPIGKSP